MGGMHLPSKYAAAINAIIMRIVFFFKFVAFKVLAGC